MDIRFLRSLCRRLTPASLRVGNKEARRRTFLVGATRQAGELRLALGPVPSCPPGPGRAIVDFSDAGREFWVGGTLTATADGGAEMTVESGPVERPPRSVRLSPAADVAFAICIVEVEGGGRQCYPILDIGVRGLRLETGAPLSIGTVLADLIVIFRREVLRRGEGVITSCSPVRYPDGRLVYECGGRRRRGRSTNGSRSTISVACAPSSGRFATSNTRSLSRGRPASSRGGCCRNKGLSAAGSPSCAAG